MYPVNVCVLKQSLPSCWWHVVTLHQQIGCIQLKNANVSKFPP